jgi:peptidoglycan hydrolase CwlO-like protein
MSKPDYASDKAGAAKIKQEETEVGAIKQDVADLQKKVDALQAKLDSAKGNTPSKSQ